jgi:hypothetical protein
MRRVLRENGLSIVMLGLFLLFLLGQSLAGHRAYNDEQREHDLEELRYVQYLSSSHFLEATGENWESEFLQMLMYVVLTVFLYQKGSAESKKLDEPNPVDRDPRRSRDKSGAPWPVRRGGLVLKLYENSLGLALLALFLLSLYMHASGGAREYAKEQAAHGALRNYSTLEYMGTARFWFESFQNWQSEFLAIGSMVVLSIWLRQRGSPESKPVDSPHRETAE